MSSKPTPPPGIAQNLLADRQSLPGMIPQEIVIFKAWWAEHYTEYDAPDFNVRVGTGFDPGSKFDDSVRTSTIANSKRRIDALLHRGTAPTIVEVKYRATPLAIGQLLCYRVLWLKDNANAPIPDLLLLCFQVDADTIYCSIILGVKIVVQDADLSGIKITKQD